MYGLISLNQKAFWSRLGSLAFAVLSRVCSAAYIGCAVPAYSAVSSIVSFVAWCADRTCLACVVAPQIMALGPLRDGLTKMSVVMWKQKYESWNKKSNTFNKQKESAVVSGLTKMSVMWKQKYESRNKKKK